MMYLKEPGKKIKTPILAWLLVGGSEKIIIDTGGSPPDGLRYLPYSREDGQEMVSQLALHGVTPSEVTKIILTHLHWDHAGSNNLFVQADFYVQKKELDYAKSPLPIHLNSYDQQLLFRSDSSYTILDGPTDLTDGLSLIPSPGHSPGSQSVIVNTTSGPYVIVGDLIALYSCFEADPMIANGIHTDLVTYYDSLNHIKALNCPILPGHDPLVLSQKVYPPI
jgi:glyoxylase-like metal-dependent hydrolase (beta-lactamase superfamily II)